MSHSFRRTVLFVLVWVLVTVAFSSAQMKCPEMPSTITQVNHDVVTEANLGIGSLGKVKAGQLGAKVDVLAKNLFDRFPNTDRILIVQMMAATYCPMIRDDKTLKDADKRRLVTEFQDRVFRFVNPDYKPPVQTKPTPKASPTDTKQSVMPQQFVELWGISDAQRVSLKKDLQALTGSDLRLVSVGSSANINIASQALHDVFDGWKIFDATVGIGPPMPDGSYLTSQDISSELTRTVYGIFQRYGVRLPLIPDAYAGPMSLGPAGGIVIVLH